MGGRGFLIPPWYQAEDTSEVSLTLITFLFGFSTACAAFTGTSIVHQGHRTWHRSRKVLTHPYIAMVCAEWLSSVIISIVNYLFIYSVIPPSFWLFFGILCLWVVQMQCIMQIIINRIALIMYNSRKVRRLKWTVAFAIGVINVSVFIVWLPARLQINERWMLANSIWDRIEKGIFAMIDLGLNLYFIYLVRSELITHGLTKYRNLYKFNLGMIFISISLDVVLIGLMSLPHESSFIYVQFHPLMYLIKLKIEMNMADLIVKIVKATCTAPAPDHELHRYAGTIDSSHNIARPNQCHINTGTSKKSAGSGSRDSQTNILVPISNNNRNSSSPGGEAGHDGWELKQMPASFDIGDVVDVRKASIAEGSGGGLMVPIPTRPVMMRNMSEMTQLEIGEGYMSPCGREKRNTILEQSGY